MTAKVSSRFGKSRQTQGKSAFFLFQELKKIANFCKIKRFFLA